MHVVRWMDAKVEDLEKLKLGLSVQATMVNKEITELIFNNYETGVRLRVRKDSWSMKVEIPLTVEKWQVKGQSEALEVKDNTLYDSEHAATSARDALASTFPDLTWTITKTQIEVENI